MKILKRHIISTQEAERLIEKYYEGETLVAEENLLRNFLSQKNIPVQFEAEKAIFGYFENEKTAKKQFIMPDYLKWTAAAAVVATIVITTIFSNRPAASNYAYIDGVKTTDRQVVLTLAKSTVNYISNGNSEVETSLDNIRQNNVIEGQLDVFSGIEF